MHFTFAPPISIVHVHMSHIHIYTIHYLLYLCFVVHIRHLDIRYGKELFYIAYTVLYNSYTHTTYCIKQGACGYRVRRLGPIFFFAFLQGPFSYGVQHPELETSGVTMVALIGPSPRSVLNPKPKP